MGLFGKDIGEGMNLRIELNGAWFYLKNVRIEQHEEGTLDKNRQPATAQIPYIILEWMELNTGSTFTQRMRAGGDPLDTVKFFCK